MKRNLDSNYQRSPNIIVTALNTILSWHSFWDPRVLLNPLRPFVQKYNGYVLKKHVHQEIEKRFQEIKDERLMNVSGQQKSHSIKSVITLALEAYLADRQDTGISQDEKLDRTFADYASYQIRVFLFAGTDTTASIMVYIYHYLSKNPDWARKLREEHDQIFGKDPNDAAAVLKNNPSLLNKCKLTLAFIKETLRLRAPAGTLRDSVPGVTVTDLEGNEQPMDIAGANILHQALHVNPRVWPRPMEFLPERFLVGPHHELYPDPAAFRPFEQGPRNCIGQTLVWNELRIAAILTIRDLEIRDAYEDFDAKAQREMGIGERWKRRLFGEPVRTVHGERAYQTDSGGLHPVNGYPCYVKWADGRTDSQQS